MISTPASSHYRMSKQARRAVAALLLAAPAIGGIAQPAMAENIFGSLMGLFSRPAPPPRAPEIPLGYGDRTSDPNDPSNLPAAQRNVPVHRGGTAFCVRLCDGRYFPLSRTAGTSPADTCSSFCPTTKTKVYWGGDIDHAVGDDGTGYDQLPNAYVYRDKLIDNCTCNGKDSIGLTRIDTAADPTLRPGDVVATRDGLQVFNGGGSNRVAKRSRHFTPVVNDRKLSADERRKLATTLVAPSQ
jgi:Protein of unknown function (DUF2865)